MYNKILGKPNGKGIYTWNNGEIYDGEWGNGLKHGSGVWRGNACFLYIYYIFYSIVIRHSRRLIYW